MAARIYVLAIESEKPLDIQAVKTPGPSPKAAMQCLTFEVFATIDGAGHGKLCRELAAAIGRDDLAAMVRR